MDRRNFLGMMVGGVAAAAAVRTWPFRVFSFPKEIKKPLPEFVTLNQTYIHLGKEGVWQVDSIGSHLLSVRQASPMILHPDALRTFREWERRAPPA